MKRIVVAIALSVVALVAFAVPASASKPPAHGPTPSFVIIEPNGDTVDYGEVLALFVSDKFTDAPTVTVACSQPSGVVIDVAGVASSYINFPMVSDTWTPGVNASCLINVGHISSGNGRFVIDTSSTFTLHAS